MLTEALLNKVEDLLSEKFGRELKISEHQTIGGGSINDAYRLKTESEDFFIKVNSLSRFPKMFEKEAEGLRTLKVPTSIEVPLAILTDKMLDQAFIIMNFIKSGSPKKDFWYLLAKGMAALHKVTNENFGFTSDNYIGSLTQSNNHHAKWSDFFIEERLEILVKKARDKGVLPKETMSHFDILYNKLDDFFPSEKPSLLHGDLWSGNYTCNVKGEPVIFDPAVYYGHREMDLGMSKLFGGFSPEFYKVYNEYYPLEKAWQERIDIANLYPLMVHVILFGGSYLYDVQRILKRMV